MHRARLSLEYVNYIVDCLGFFSGKTLNEMVHKNKCIHEQHENHFHCVREHQSFGKNIACVANWVRRNFSERIVLLHKRFF